MFESVVPALDDSINATAELVVGLVGLEVDEDCIASSSGDESRSS